MPQFFPESFIQEVIDRNNLEDVVSGYVSLKRAGSTMKGLCPFHREKTPSFSVSVDKQLYHCFGCGAGGTVINFIMHIENLDFIEAVKYLTDKAGMDLPESASDNSSKMSHEMRQQLYQLNKDTAHFFYSQLFQPVGAKALEYVKERALTPQTVKHFGLGYSPPGGALTTHLKGLGYDEDTMLLAGVTASTDSGRIYERFANRLIFPIIDQRKNVIGFGGRVMDDSMPKYLNTSDTPVFSKSHNLFALQFAKKTSENYLLLVEGYMDVISLHQSGIISAVATLGTALTEEQARIIKRCKNEVVIAYDSDSAGQAATRRAIEILADCGLVVRVLTLRDCKDPDEFIKKYGAGALKQQILEAPVQIEYKIRKLQDKYDLNHAQEKVDYIKELAAELAKLDSEVEREIYTNKTAEETGVSAAAIFSEIERVLIKNTKKRQYRKDFDPPTDTFIRKMPNAEKLLLTLMEQDGHTIQKIRERLTPEDFQQGAYRELARALFEGRDTKAILSHPDYATELSNILFEDCTIDNMDQSVEELITNMLIQRNKSLQQQALKDNDLQKLNELIMEGRRLGAND